MYMFTVSPLSASMIIKFDFDYMWLLLCCKMSLTCSWPGCVCADIVLYRSGLQWINGYLSLTGVHNTKKARKHFFSDCYWLYQFIPPSRGHFVSFISVHCSSVFSVSQKTIAIWSVILFKLTFKWCGDGSCIQCRKWSLKHSSGASLYPALDWGNFSP